jgi:hypothetical protein
MSIHERLFEAACGEIRFAFDTAGTLVTKVVTEIRQTARLGLASRVVVPAVLEAALTAALKKAIDRQIPDDVATRMLAQMADDGTRGVRASVDESRWSELLKGGTLDEGASRGSDSRRARSSRVGFLKPFVPRGC